MVLCACVLGWLYLQWGTFYAKLDLRRAVIYLLLANSGGSTLKAITHFIPIEAQCISAMLLPIVSVSMCWDCTKGHQKRNYGEACHSFRVPQSERALEGRCRNRRLQLRNRFPGEPDLGKPSSNTSR